MIVDWKKDHAVARRTSVISERTGECLDSECIFYADDEAGYYLRHIKDERGKYYQRDSRTGERLIGRSSISAVPPEFVELAWERVDRCIRFVSKPDGRDAGAY